MSSTSRYADRRCHWGQRITGLGCLALVLAGCYPAVGEETGTSCRQQSLQASSRLEDFALPYDGAGNPLLVPAWVAYKERFILSSGRVVDREDGDRTVSEGQAYAMLRAVLINDRQTFERTLSWAEANLARPEDSLWSWLWGEADGTWGVKDANFATDADVDAATALILAARRWNCPAYVNLAKTKLGDIWTLGTAGVGVRQRHLLPGPADAFWHTPSKIVLNPSYFAPYAFRLFAQVDPHRDWMSLVDTGYDLLARTGDTSPIGLPGDWVQIDLQTGQLNPVPDEIPLVTRYSFDAFRVWWRVSLDAVWFDEPRAEAFLKENLTYLSERWTSDRALPASLSLTGEPLADYETTAQYAMLYPALKLTAPLVAHEIYLEKILPSYNNGLWDHNNAYYAQNLAWFGLLPLERPQGLLE